MDVRLLVDAAHEVPDGRPDTVANVIGRASWFGSELFALRGTEWRCTVDGAAAQRRLGPDTKRHLLLLIKEALNNIAKHAGAREARLEVTLTGGDLALTIVDDGQGFDVAAVPRANAHANGDGHGLSNMDARARAMGGSWEVTSAPGQGCRIRIRIPLAAYFSP
jgi:signal transduction histidine kinase